MTTLSPLGLAALSLASECAFRVLPIHTPAGDTDCSCGRPACAKPGKHPRTANGFKDATTHPEQIAAWWDRWPDANIGLYPGASQLVVVDIDGPAGEATARRLSVFDEATLEATTARGVHRYFRLPDGVVLGNPSPFTEMDIRAHAGYVLAPPSLHASGTVYAWRGPLDEIADVPASLLAALLAPAIVRDGHRPAHRLPFASARAHDARAEARVLAYADRMGYGLSDGRKTAAYRFAAFLSHDVGLDEGASWAFLTTWNAHNVPALRSGALSEIHANARKYGGRSGAA